MYLFITIPVRFFFFFGITCTMAFHLLGYVPTDPPKNKFTCLPSCFSSSSHKDLPVTTTTCVHVHTWTRSWHYLFIFIPINHWNLPVNVSAAVHVHRCTCPTLCDHLWSIQLTTEIYPSMCLLLYMYTNAPVHQYTCSVYFFLFGVTCTFTFPLICGGIYT